MKPDSFIAKWQGVELKERSASQSHFNDLRALLDVPDPITADPRGEWFTFERGATKTTGGKGWADLWRRDCFAWEYKGRHANLDAAYAQVQRYAPALANPPLLIVSDMGRIVIRTHWTGLVVETHEVALHDLRDARHRDRLRDCLEEPERLRPRKTRADLTEEAAGRFAGLAAGLASRGHAPDAVAHFVNRLVFCMFAEDVGLLPNKLFERMLESCKSDPDKFSRRSRELFAAMNRKGGDEVAYERVDWFNGGLFDDDGTLPLTREEIADLHSTAKLNWSEIDATLMGTLFERGLDPAKRSQLGAHYTDAGKIMQIVEPVVLRPLRAEWAAVRAEIVTVLDRRPVATAERLLTPSDRGTITRLDGQATALHLTFLERLRAYRVLDPACGSGNFLALTLTALKDLEHAANLDAEALGLARPAPQVGPEAVLGLEINPYAAELARVSIWIAEIQWMRRNGFDAARPDPAAARHGAMRRRAARRAGGRAHAARLARSRRHCRQPAVPWEQANDRGAWRGLRHATTPHLVGRAGRRRPRGLLVCGRGRRDPHRTNGAGGAGRNELDPRRGKSGGAQARSNARPYLRGLVRRTLDRRGGGRARVDGLF